MGDTDQIVIVGGGPAGLSTALHLALLRPGLRERILVLEKDHYPREKLCGGAIARSGDIILKRLGLAPDFAQVPIDTIRIQYRDRHYDLQGDPVCRIVHRANFDAWLAGHVRQAGVRIVEGARVRDVAATGDKHVLTTDEAEYRARVLIAADGSRSVVKQKLDWPGQQGVARLLECWTIPRPEDAQLYTDGVLLMNFDVLDSGLQGYRWVFPSQRHNQRTMNEGVFDSRIVPGPHPGSLKPYAVRSADPTTQINGHPLNHFHPRSVISMPGVLLVGDAAGADPLFGEGISFALEFGNVAAQAIVRACERNDFSFADYRRRVMKNPLLKDLRRRSMLARIAYRVPWPWLRSVGWRGAKGFAHRMEWPSPDPALTAAAQ